MAAHRFTLRLPEELFEAIAADAARHGRSVAAEIRDRLRPDRATAKQITALHARGHELDGALRAPRGRAKAEALLAAGEHFGRELSSAGDLSMGEASWILDWLRERLEA